MLTAGQEKEHHTAVTPQHTRTLAYIVAGCIFSAGVYKGYYSTNVIAVIPLTLLVPSGIRWLSDWLENRYPDQQQGALLMVDAFATGIAISAASYSLVPTLTFTSNALACSVIHARSFSRVAALTTRRKNSSPRK